MAMKNSLLIIAFFSLSGMLLFGCAIPKYQNDADYLSCKNLSDDKNCQQAGGQLGCRSSDQDKCMLSLALNYSDPELCNEIDSDVPYGVFVYEKVTDREECMAWINEISKDPSHCNGVGGTNYSEICEDYATRTLDFGICDRLGGNWTDSCYFSIVEKRHNDIVNWTVCDRFLPDACYYCHAMCYSYAAYETENMSFCSKIRRPENPEEFETDLVLYNPEQCFGFAEAQKNNETSD